MYMWEILSMTYESNRISIKVQVAMEMRRKVCLFVSIMKGEMGESRKGSSCSWFCQPENPRHPQAIFQYLVCTKVTVWLVWRKTCLNCSHVIIFVTFRSRARKSKDCFSSVTSLLCAAFSIDFSIYAVTFLSVCMLTIYFQEQHYFLS